MNLKRRKGRVGVTLLELLVVLVMMGFLTYALIYAFVGGIDMERRQSQRQSEQNPTARLERRITRLLTEATLSEDTADQTTYFVAATESEGALGADRLTFTTTAPGLSLAAQQSVDDFETQHEQSGPQGGVAEVSFGTTPVGQAVSTTGLFERLQRPADGDETQGGTEAVLEASVTQLGFEFYDGTQWTTEWDTLNSGTRRLPAAVRVSYTLSTDADAIPHSFVVRLPASDVDADNPANTSTTATTPTTGATS
jgi:type II secretory pathway pseudopilin PulG